MEKTAEKMDKRRVARLKHIYDATRILIEKKNINEVTFPEIAKEADIPVSSLYHYFSAPEDVFFDLTKNILEYFQNTLSEPLDYSVITHWKDVQTIIEERHIQYYNNHKFARELLLGNHIYSRVLQADLSNDLTLGEQIYKIYDQLYYLPRLPNEYNIFSIALEVTDRVYSISHRQHGYITDIMAKEAIRLSHAYLGLYLPRYMQSKPIEIYSLKKALINQGIE